MTTAERKIEDLLIEMDGLFSGYYRWLAGQYDPATGGIYYARSSYEIAGFIPDIESTAQALNILQRSDLLAALPTALKEKMILFFQNKQDPVSGYFYDEDEIMRDDAIMVARALSYSLGSLQKLGGKPRYRLPHEAMPLPKCMQSPLKYVEWLKGVDLRNSWRGCDLMTTVNHHIAKLDENERNAFVQAGADYFASIQDQDTGLWGAGNLYIRISGTFKLSAFYNRFGLPVPNADRIYQTLIHSLRNEQALDMCWVRNPIDLLWTLRDEIQILQEEFAEIVEITVSNMRKFLRNDGGFSREIDHSPVAPNVAQVKNGEYYPNMPKPVSIGKGLIEGDMNAGTQALLIREFCYRLAGKQHLPLANTEDFLNVLSSRI
ncbi:MAG: hypothetical protein JWN30_1178 [Bacilli bacterium]|nr:hypothetical protein [Bacilli bacterium]